MVLLISMLFCQFADCASLCEISNSLHSSNGNLNHPTKQVNTFYQNEKRSCEFFGEYYYSLLQYFRQQVKFSGRKFHFSNAIMRSTPRLLLYVQQLSTERIILSPKVP